MTVFEFTFSLLAIILGLGLCDLAISFHRLVMNHGRVKWHPLPLLAAAMSLWAIILQWWTSWQGRDAHQMEFSSLVFEIVQALVLFLMAAASLPDKGDEGEIDLGAYYDRVRPYYMSLALVTVLFAGVIPVLIGLARGEPLWEPALANIPLAVMFGACIFVRQRWFNTLVLGLLVALLSVRWGVTVLKG